MSGASGLSVTLMSCASVALTTGAGCVVAVDPTAVPGATVVPSPAAVPEATGVPVATGPPWATVVPGETAVTGATVDTEVTGTVCGGAGELTTTGVPGEATSAVFQ